MFWLGNMKIIFLLRSLNEKSGMGAVVALVRLHVFAGFPETSLLNNTISIVVPTKSDSDVLFCLQLLSKTLTCALHLS